MLSEFWNLTWESLKPGPTALAVCVGLIPFLLWSCTVLFQKRFRSDVTPPQQEKLLRPPGYSLQRKFEDLFDSILDNLLGSSLLFLIATIGAIGTFAFGRALFEGMGGAVGFAIFFATLLVVSAVPGIVLLSRAIRNTSKARNVRLGLRGEQAVAEVLHELGGAGYRAFHDLQPDGTWNIDHVIVGTRGLFAIETKTRCRRPPKNEQPKHVVIYDGRNLIFPSGNDTDAVPQAERNASWLADYLAKRTCEAVPVEAIIVVPGWYTESKGTYPVKVMNHTYLRSFLRKQPERIDPCQVQRIIAALDEKCRTLEF